MKIGIASDHRGFTRKLELIRYLKLLGHEVIDYGTDNKESSDYPEFAFKLGEDIAKIDFGILICGTGIGMSIAANKVRGVRCARIVSIDDAKHARIDNNANVMAISNNLCLRRIKQIIKVFIETQFSDEERHHKRIKMIDKYVNKL